jgi:DNA-binding LytR/AlgR family response regulator
MIFMILNQPFPSNQEFSRIIRFTFYSGCVVFLILILFQPFGFDKTPFNHLFRNAFFFGLATFITATANAVLLPIIFPRFFDEQKWTVGRELTIMLWQVILISFANLLLFKWLYNDNISAAMMINVLGITAAVGIFPISLVIFLKQYALLKKYGSSAARLDQQIHEQAGPRLSAPKSIIINIPGDNQHESASFYLEDFRFISSADNYIKVHFIEKGNLSIKVLRSTLKKSGERLESYEQIFRCHRTFIVNLAAVDRVTGNAQGYKLRLNGVDELVPVSRNLNSELTARLNKLSPSNG